MTSTDLLNEARKVSDSSLRTVKERLLSLSQTQLTWRPNEVSWNIQEIFCHLNQYAAYYHQAFKRSIEKTKFALTRENYLSSPLGRSAWKSMKLGRAQNVKRKFKAPKAYNPRLDPTLLTGQDVKDFEANLGELFGIFDQAAKVDLRRVKIPISISKIVRLRLGDALLFVVYHNERHVQQALNIIAHPKFPK